MIESINDFLNKKEYKIYFQIVLIVLLTSVIYPYPTILRKLLNNIIGKYIILVLYGVVLNVPLTTKIFIHILIASAFVLILLEYLRIL